VCVYITVLLRCAASFVPFLSRLPFLISPRKGYKKLHLSGERDVLLSRDVEIYVMLLDISEILNIL